jgi:uncharacterized membrane protein YeaQ/YmgE (transglycosylase-associated protein family)
MAEFEVLGTDKSVDTSDPMGTLMTIVSLIVGAAVLFMVLPIGRQLGNWVNSQIASLTGNSVGDSSPGITFGGD